MNISAISEYESSHRRNLFIKYANQFMSFKASPDGDERTTVPKPEPIEPAKKTDKSMGIETLTIFPKQVIDGKTIITA